MRIWIGLGLLVAPVILAIIFILHMPFDWVYWPKWVQKLHHRATYFCMVAAFAAGLALMITSC